MRAAGMRDSWRSCHLRCGEKECAPLQREGLGRPAVPAEGIFLGELGTLSQYSYSYQARASSAQF